MLFHRRQDAQIALDTSRVVIANILLNHLNKLVLAGEPSAVIAFPFQDAPEALHGPVIDAMRHAGHALPYGAGHIGRPSDRPSQRRPIATCPARPGHHIATGCGHTG